MKNLNLKKYFFPIGILLLLGILFFTLNNKPKAPDVTFTTIEGKKIAMADLKGKMVLVNFWATDCPGCIKEMPALVETYKTYQTQGLEIIAVAMPYDPPAQVANYMRVKQLPFPVMHDGFSEMTKKFGGVSLVPTSYIFNKNGEQLQRTIGELDFAQLDQLIQKELKK